MKYGEQREGREWERKKSREKMTAAEDNFVLSHYPPFQSKDEQNQK